MRVERDLDVTAPPERLWAVLWDVPRMVACLPGCTEAREVEPQKRYEAHMSQRVGPISLSVPMQVTIVDVVPPGSLALEAKGRDGSLGASVAMSVRLGVGPRGGGRDPRQAWRPRPRHHPVARGRAHRRVRRPAQAGGGGLMLRPFALHRPATVAEASEILAQEGRDAALYAGGTELLLILKEGLLRVNSLVDVKRLPGLADIRADDGHLLIGATVTHRTVEHAPEVHARCPLIARVARHVANVRVRSVGTVGGNLAFADPHSDLATAFLLFDATVRLATRAGERELALRDFRVCPLQSVPPDAANLKA